MDDELWMLLFQISFILFILFIYISHHMFVHNVILRDWRKFLVKIGEKKILRRNYFPRMIRLCLTIIYIFPRNRIFNLFYQHWTFFEVKFASLISRYTVYTTRVKINIIKCHVYSIHSKNRKKKIIGLRFQVWMLLSRFHMKKPF